jgi:hypothetical protein
MHTISAKLMTKEQTSFTELLDNVEGIILDLDNLHYYTLNTTGLFVWKQLRGGVSHTREQLCDSLGKAYNVDSSTIEPEVDGFLEELETNGLIQELKGDVPVNAKFAESNGQLPGYEAPRLKLSNSLTQVVLSGSSTIATAAIATG